MDMEVQKMQLDQLQKLKDQKDYSDSVEHMRALLLDVMQKCIQTNMTGFLGGARSVEPRYSDGRNAKQEVSMSVLPVNEQCALMIQIESDQIQGRGTEGANRVDSDKWKGQLVVLDLQTMQPTLAVDFRSEFSRGYNNGPDQIHANVQFVHVPPEGPLSLPSLEGLGVYSKMLEKANQRKPNLVVPPQAALLESMLSAHFNGDIGAAAAAYRKAINTDIMPVQAITTMMQMGIEGQIKLSDAQVVKMAQSIGVTPYKDANMLPPSEIGELNASKVLSTRRRIAMENEGATASKPNSSVPNAYASIKG